MILKSKMVRRHLNQNYSKLKRDLQRRSTPEQRELFRDPHFPPTSESLFFSGKNDPDIVWKRPGVSVGGREDRVGGWGGKVSDGRIVGGRISVHFTAYPFTTTHTTPTPPHPHSTLSYLTSSHPHSTLSLPTL